MLVGRGNSNTLWTGCHDSCHAQWVSQRPISDTTLDAIPDSVLSLNLLDPAQFDSLTSPERAYAE